MEHTEIRTMFGDLFYHHAVEQSIAPGDTARTIQLIVDAQRRSPDKSLSYSLAFGLVKSSVQMRGLVGEQGVEYAKQLIGMLEGVPDTWMSSLVNDLEGPYGLATPALVLKYAP